MRPVSLRHAVEKRRNVLVAGGTSTGKTTLVNALLAEVAKTTDRVVLIEDTRELQCTSPNSVALRTKDGVASLSDLVRSSLRLRPDRIPIGEVRGAEALDLLKAWGTGHPGGIGTIHAGSAIGALRRLEQLIQEAVVTVPRALIVETIDLIAVLAGRGPERRLVELAAIEALGPNGDYLLVSTTPGFEARGREGMTRSLAHVRHCVPTMVAVLLLGCATHTGSCCWFEHALGATAATDPAVYRGPSGQDHGGDHHHRHRADARLRRHFRRIPPPRSDRVRPLDRICSELVLPVVLLLRRRSAGLMSEIHFTRSIPGFEAPVHRALTEPILLGGAPRAVAITNGTLAAAVGLGLAPLDRRPPAVGDRSSWRRSGRQSATRSSSTSCAGTSVIRRISACKADRHAQPR